jgi:hypothetical protein
MNSGNARRKEPRRRVLDSTQRTPSFYSFFMHADIREHNAAQSMGAGRAYP